jgi:hypothetical protein
MKKRWGDLLVLFLLSLGWPVCAQRGKTTSNPPPVHADPEEVVRQLTSPDTKIRKAWVDKLGLHELNGDNESLASLSVEEKHAAFLQNVASRLILVDEGEVCQTMYLVPMIDEGGGWTTLQAIPLSTQYEPPKITFESLVGEGEQEIILRHLWVDHGTGIQQTNLTIYKLIDGAMRIIFDQPEHLHFSTRLNPDHPYTYDEDQESTFKFVKNDSDAAAPTAIEETRVETVGKRKLTVYREYSWEPEIQAYQMFGAGLP